jgi:hypothetical protein
VYLFVTPALSVLEKQEFCNSWAIKPLDSRNLGLEGVKGLEGGSPRVTRPYLSATGG